MTDRVYKSARLDTLIDIGTGADTLSRLSARRPDLCIRLHWGRLEAGYHDEEPTVLVGTMGVELTADNWQAFGLLAAAIPYRAGVFPK